TLQQTNVELENASRMKSEFLANMSHELRTPLNAIIGFSEVLKDGMLGNLTDQQKGFIGDIFGSGQHLLSLINDILDLSKVEAGKMLLDLEPVAVSSLFENSLSVVREKAAARQIRLRMDAGTEVGILLADARKVKQIAYNLLSNAVKFTGEGGEVTLRARRVSREAVESQSASIIDLSMPSDSDGVTDFLEISVRDTGIGIAPDALERLFKPFSQIDSGLSRKFEGTGLGLAMVKQLAALHGGSVAVESTVGVGSCFTVWLPFREPTGHAVRFGVPVPVERRKIPITQRTALVVEDDDKSAQLVRVQLEAEGFTVIHASSGEEALDMAARQPLSLITLDIMLKEMDGWEVLSRLKQLPDLKRIPVVIISIVGERYKGFALGAAAVVQKPISRHELSASLADLGLLYRSSGQALEVLVIDDDPASTEIIAAALDGVATTVTRARDGTQAAELARQRAPDLIILDLMIRTLNGFDVVEALARDPATASIPIVVVTAELLGDSQRARLNGFVTTVIEQGDFTEARLKAEVRRAMAGRPAAD
ncbi:MAG: response regulator, partial [Gemmatimonadaceae bacterium]